MTLDDIFGYTGELHRWVPFKLVFNPKRNKHDKVPHNGRHGLSTTDPLDWKPLLTALQIAKEGFGLSGVGFVMTDGIEVDGWTLVGFDFDGITEDFTIPFETYTEWSPSGKGARVFAWAPTSWALKYQDSTDTYPPHCDHAEIYIGTAPRFLTVTFDVVHLAEFKQLEPKDLKAIESWGMNLYQEKPAAPMAPDTEGTPVDFKRIKLTKDMQALIDGAHEGDKSKTMQGLIIRLLDSNVSNEDVFATLVQTPNLWAYLLSHRSSNEDKALKFAQKEINNAYPLSKKGKREKLVSFNKKWAIETPNEATMDYGPPPFPKKLYYEAPGLVGEIGKWIMGASYAPREEYAYATALVVMSCLIGPYCSFSRESKVNLFIVLVGDTGDGKNEAFDSGIKLLSMTDAKDCVLDFPASDVALRRQLVANPNALIRADEVAHTIECLSRGDANGGKLMKMILDTYNNSRLPPKVYADSKNSLPAVENPFVQIIGGTTGKIWDVIQPKHLEDGTLNRIIFVSLPDDAPYSENDDPSYELPKALKDRLNTFWRQGRMHDLIGDMPSFGRRVEFAPEVKEAVKALGPVLHQRGKESERGALYGRFILNTSKIATILAVGDGRMAVTMADFEQARAFMEWSIENTHYQVSAKIAGSQFEKLAKKLQRILEKAGGRMTLRDLYKAANIYKWEADKVIDTMEASGTVVLREEDNESRNGTMTTWVELYRGVRE